MKRKYTFIDLFAGCGGLSEGFYMEDFEALAHVEIDAVACKTLKTRMDYYGYSDSESAVLEADITSEDMLERIEGVVNGAEVDVIIGGPPCQSFSSLGRAKDDNGMKNDPRNYLFESYVKILNHFLPKFFVFENVTGLLTATLNGERIVNKITSELSKHYNVKLEVLNSANYGVPQIRKRVIIIGVRSDIDLDINAVYSSIVKTHYDPEMPEESRKGLKKYVTVRDAIEELPKVLPGQGSKSVAFKSRRDNEFLRRIVKKNACVLLDHVARNHNETDIERYRVMSKEHWSFQELLQNRPDLNHEKQRVFGNSYTVQWWDLPSKTIIAHLYKDGNQFIHPDYTQGRTFTAREAARIQSFPDDFVFEGARTDQFKQIGNAVPPLLANAIAKALKQHLVELDGKEDDIFKPITRIRNKTEKDFCVELTQVYRRLVEVYCQKHEIAMISQASEEMIAKEMCEIGIIETPSDLGALRTFLGKDYAPFADAVSFAVEHKTELKETLFKLYNSYRKEAQIGWDSKPLRVVDFFCGAGGLSLGFIHEGFNIALANDIEDVCIQTYTYNHPELPSRYVIQGDIKAIVDNVQQYIVGDIDVVVGGPPCQGFSEANRQRIIDDPRNELYKYFVKAVERIAPKFVVMENVKGMMKVADQVVEDYERLSIKRNGVTYTYKVAYRVLNSQNFCVAQSRERLIYIAVRNDVMTEHNITPEKIFSEICGSTNGNPTFVLADALADIKPLEAPRVRNTNEIDSEITGKKIDVNAAEIHDNAYLNLINCGRRIPYLFNHKARYCSDVNYEIYKRLNPGDDATDEKIKDIMPYAHRNHCFKDKYFKLHADRPCRTITAHLRMDCHSHIHPYQVRSLTPREAARAQSFPDDYLFLGAYLKTYMQIGNAVPTLMANGIAKIIKKYLVKED